MSFRDQHHNQETSTNSPVRVCTTKITLPKERLADYSMFPYFTIKPYLEVDVTSLQHDLPEIPLFCILPATHILPASDQHHQLPGAAARRRSGLCTKLTADGGKNDTAHPLQASLPS